jgi:dienelactone hydrolase
MTTPTRVETPIPGYEELVQLFNYDQDLPVDLVVESEQQQGSAVVQTITYTGGMGFRVPAYLVIPNGGGPYSAVIYLHKGAGDKNQYLTEALMLASMGVVSLLLDSPFVSNPYGGEWPRDDYPGTMREGIIRQIIDVRRGVDLLVTIPQVDSTRVGYVGHSLGATFGGIVAGVEPRIKAYVLMAGCVQFSTMYFDGPIKPEPSPDLDAVHYVGHASAAAILFQYGQFDLSVYPSEGRAYFRAASEPKTILWYEADHDSLEWKSQADRLQWLSEQLGFVYQPM